MCGGAHRYTGQKDSAELGLFFHLPCGLQGPNSGHQACMATVLPAEPHFTAPTWEFLMGPTIYPIQVFCLLLKTLPNCSGVPFPIHSITTIYAPIPQIRALQGHTSLVNVPGKPVSFLLLCLYFSYNWMTGRPLFSTSTPLPSITAQRASSHWHPGTLTLIDFFCLWTTEARV